MTVTICWLDSAPRTESSLCLSDATVAFLGIKHVFLFQEKRGKWISPRGILPLFSSNLVVMSLQNDIFTYTPLGGGEIRLLCPSVEAEGAIWSLETVRLDGSTFDALSYTWGDLTHTFPFTCNGQMLQIHQNLKNALPYLAKRQSSLPICINAVCINQSNNVEKFSQVRMMHDIYRRAAQSMGVVRAGART